jgi:hypothetical protein
MLAFHLHHCDRLCRPCSFQVAAREWIEAISAGQTRRLLWLFARLAMWYSATPKPCHDAVGVTGPGRSVEAPAK